MKRKFFYRILVLPVVTDADAVEVIQIQRLCHEGAPRLSLFYTSARGTYCSGPIQEVLCMLQPSLWY
jgi:hypothetical protein